MTTTTIKSSNVYKLTCMGKGVWWKLALYRPMVDSSQPNCVIALNWFKVFDVNDRVKCTSTWTWTSWWVHDWMATLRAKNATNIASQDPLDGILQLFYCISLLNLHGWEWCLEKKLLFRLNFDFLAFFGLSCRRMSTEISPLQCQMYAHILGLSIYYHLHNSYMVFTNNNTWSTSVHISGNYSLIFKLNKSLNLPKYQLKASPPM